MYIKLILMGVFALVLIICTWEVQNWRWEAKQLAAVNQAVEMSQAEAKTAAAAATVYETKKETTDVKFQKIDAALDKAASAHSTSSSKCLDTSGLLLVNSALSRKTAAPRRPTLSLPGLAPAD